MTSTVIFSLTVATLILFGYNCNGAPTTEANGLTLPEVEDLQHRLQQRQSEGLRGCRICFQEVEGSSQCQGVRFSCSGWSHVDSSWTSPFRDDTDGRDGGCTYQWRVECI